MSLRIEKRITFDGEDVQVLENLVKCAKAYLDSLGPRREWAGISGWTDEQLNQMYELSCSLLDEDSG